MQGSWRPEHLFELRQAYDLYQFHHRQIAECDRQIEEELAKFPDRAGADVTGSSRARAGARATTWRFEATGPLFQALGVDLTLIEGIDVATALVILAEIGVDVSRFPTEKHFASLAGAVPEHAREQPTTKKRGAAAGEESGGAGVAAGGPGGGPDARRRWGCSILCLGWRT